MLAALEQALLALGYYFGLIVMLRVLGKRLAGQTTSFDLVVLISLGVVLQTTMLRPGATNALVFIVVVFAVHRGLALACVRWPRLRKWVRGEPRPLVEHGKVSLQALEDERLSYEELLAGLRKSGCADVQQVKLATLEETGQISAIPEDRGSGH